MVFWLKLIKSFDKKNIDEEVMKLVSLFDFITQNIPDIYIGNFLRFILINLFESGVYGSDELLAKKILFQQAGELIIQNYLAIGVNNDKNILKSHIFIDGISGYKLNDLEIFYINYERSKKLENDFLN
jgi:hypothetical protein